MSFRNLKNVFLFKYNSWISFPLAHLHAHLILCHLGPSYCLLPTFACMLDRHPPLRDLAREHCRISLMRPIRLLSLHGCWPKVGIRREEPRRFGVQTHAPMNVLLLQKFLFAALAPRLVLGRHLLLCWLRFCFRYKLVVGFLLVHQQLSRFSLWFRDQFKIFVYSPS